MRGAMCCLLVALACGCGRDATTQAAPAHKKKGDHHRVVKSEPRATVVLQPDGGPAASVSVRLARTEGERRRGLMYVRYLPADEGMLFLFPEDEDQGFWMKNTLIPLDMIFITADMKVAGVVENAQPLDLSTRSVGKLSRYVLEVNGGWAKSHGVGAGASVRFDGFSTDGK